jgi:hypothetical protein
MPGLKSCTISSGWYKAVHQHWQERDGALHENEGELPHLNPSKPAASVSSLKIATALS